MDKVLSGFGREKKEKVSDSDENSGDEISWDEISGIRFLYTMVLDVRAKIISYYLSGYKQTEILNKLKVDKVNRMLVYRTIKRYNDTKGIADRPRSGRPSTTRSIRLRKAVRSRVARNPKRSMRKMAKDILEELKYIDRVQKPLSIMVWGGVTADSRTNLIFIPKGVKINSETYRN